MKKGLEGLEGVKGKNGIMGEWESGIERIIWNNTLC